MSKMRITRYQMYTTLFSKLPLPLTGSILGISGLKYWAGSRNYKPPVEVIAKSAKITDAKYPDVDILKLPYNDNTFDYVICDCVLEHVEGNPQQAIDEIRRVLKNKGTAIITSAFTYPIHFGPKDFWRFSPDGLKYLCMNFSTIVNYDGWGNKWVLSLFYLYSKSLDWQISNSRFSVMKFLATYNDPVYPIITWVIAKK